MKKIKEKKTAEKWDKVYEQEDRKKKKTEEKEQYRNREK